MSEPSYYALLGVDNGAGEAEIRQAYRKLALQLHPDRQGDRPPHVAKANEERFKRVAVAYDVLSDSEKRRLYDEFGLVGLRPGFDPGPWREFLKLLRGGGRFRWTGPPAQTPAPAPAPAPRRPGVNVNITHEVPFLVALRGGRTSVSHGGRVYDLNIPQGAEDGLRLRLPGHGGAGEPPGDLFVTLKVAPHRFLSRRTAGEPGPGTTAALDLEGELPLTWLEAVQGGPLAVPTPWGEWPLRFAPCEPREGMEYQLVGQGARNKHAAGDLWLRIRLVPPGDVGAEERQQLLAALRPLQRDETPRAELQASLRKEDW